ncbi:MAG TPA: hypothetical protein VLA74_13265 [Nitrososphaeraceae archaeon]|nr:hypothetical protein [Nitrososphaeraceae archaeon]
MALASVNKIVSKSLIATKTTASSSNFYLPTYTIFLVTAEYVDTSPPFIRCGGPNKIAYSLWPITFFINSFF